MLKRIFDITFSATGLLILAPLFGVVALAVKIDSSGPIFYRQARVGRYGKQFRIHKFRTMVVGAENMGPMITIEGDSRITPIGAFLRRYKLDELPQLIDVLVGSMSVVGPRPLVPEHVQHYPDDVRDAVLSVRPGITDLASIRFRSEENILAGCENPELSYVEEILPVKIEHYLDYVKKQSIMGDIRIICKTFKAVIRETGFKNLPDKE